MSPLGLFSGFLVVAYSSFKKWKCWDKKIHIKQKWTQTRDKDTEMDMDMYIDTDIDMDMDLDKDIHMDTDTDRDINVITTSLSHRQANFEISFQIYFVTVSH